MSTYPAYVATPEIRWSDQDLQGHVNNAKTITLIEEARISWLRSGEVDMSLEERPQVVARMELNYRKPVVYGPELTIELGVERVGGSSYTITCRGIQEGAVVFDGRNVMVMVDPSTGKTSPLTDQEKKVLEGYGSFDAEDPTRLD